MSHRQRVRVVSNTQRRWVSEEEEWRDLRSLERRGLTIRVAPWRLAGEVEADGDVSLADANAVALAAERDATVFVGADDDFDDLSPSLEIGLSQFRTGS